MDTKKLATTISTGLLGASVFAIPGAVQVAQAQGFVDLGQLCGTTVDADTQVKRSVNIHIPGDCKIGVENAILEIAGVKISVDGDLRVDDKSDAPGEASRLIIRNSQVTTSGRIRIEESWDGGVDFRNNRVRTGDDLRVKPIGLGDLKFRNNHGYIDGDIRLGDEGLQGDTEARNNNISISGDFRAQSTDGDIVVRNNNIRNVVEAVQIVSERGDISVKHNSFENSEGDQDVTIASDTGDVGVLHNIFGQSVDQVTIESNSGQCESERNSPEVVDMSACQP
jgi:hypothetical protein